MNSDFEKAIREMMESGKSMQEAMDALSKTWDQIKKSNTEESVSKWRKEITDVFKERWSDRREKMDSKIIIEFLFCILSYKHPEWSLEDIQTGVDAITNIVRIAEKAIGKDTVDMVGIMSREFDNLMDTVLNEVRKKNLDTGSNKDQTKDKKQKSAPGEFFTISDQDAAAIKSFFNLFGL